MEYPGVKGWALDFFSRLAYSELICIYLVWNGLKNSDQKILLDALVKSHESKLGTEDNRLSL